VNAKESDSAIGYEAACHFPPRGKALTDSRLAALCADAAWLAFLRYRADFHTITGRAADRFLRCDWPGAYADAAERLGLYGRVLDELVGTIHRLMGDRLEEKPLWAASKAVYSSFITRCNDAEIAESFFNSDPPRVRHRRCRPADRVCRQRP
jgi:isocitrate dehydrogenase kinase/phosphatase